MKLNRALDAGLDHLEDSETQGEANAQGDDGPQSVDDQLCVVKHDGHIE